MRKTISPLLLCLLAPVFAKAADFRPPAVPLITHDPYFSIWSMSDQLTDTPTKHWTGKTQSLCSLVRVDGNTFRIMGTDPRHMPAMKQTHVAVLPTHTLYQFEGGGVMVTLTFFTPVLPQSLDLVSRPVTYISWAVNATDGASHKVQVYFDASSQLTVNIPEQPVEWARYHVADLQVLRMGSEHQPVLEKSGDDLRIDWGYLYVVAPPNTANGESATVRPDAIEHFTKTGQTTISDRLQTDQPYAQPTPVLAESFDFGLIGATPVSRYVMVGYDDIYAIAYLQKRLRAYWRRNGTEAAELFRAAIQEHDALEKRATDFDGMLMKDLTAVGGEDYARLCSLAFRQTLAAHKLTIDTDGTPLYFSKENFSNGSIDTVDVTYPSSPFFLLFNPRLLEAQLRPILDYASLPRWKFPFAPHDLGRYPLANGQQYGGGEETEENQMPVEESGNMLLMIAGIAQVDGNAKFAERYWPVLTKWADYLRDKGLDPENQLSTDDFAGHLAHNANLSIKAILALAAYGKMAGTLGHSDVSSQYGKLVQGYVQHWIQTGLDGDHYKLAFDKEGTWSQKYNLVWDKLLHLNLFPPSVIEKELAFYRTHENKYGLPLDNRADYTKLDWLIWTATLAGSKQDFVSIMDPGYHFADESPTRVPLSDWYDTKTGKQVGFQARSVVGGVFIRMLAEPDMWKKYSSAATVQ